MKMELRLEMFVQQSTKSMFLLVTTFHHVLIILFSYIDHSITEAEFNSLNGRAQEHVKRTASVNLQNLQPQTSWGYYAQQAPDRLRRVDWLRERVYFEGLVRDDHYAKSRLGFKAPDVFIMELVS